MFLVSERQAQGPAALDFEFKERPRQPVTWRVWFDVAVNAKRLPNHGLSQGEMSDKACVASVGSLQEVGERRAM